MLSTCNQSISPMLVVQLSLTIAIGMYGETRAHFRRSSFHLDSSRETISKSKALVHHAHLWHFRPSRSYSSACRLRFSFRGMMLQLIIDFESPMFFEFQTEILKDSRFELAYERHLGLVCFRVKVRISDKYFKGPFLMNFCFSTRMAMLWARNSWRH